MKTIITGASGFVGQNLSRYLKQKNIFVEELSLRNKEWSTQLNQKANALIHLAGKAHDVEKTAEEKEYFEINRDLTIELFHEFLKSEIQDFAAKGYINGYGNGLFRPENTITRAEFVTIFNKYFSLTNSKGVAFNDTKGHWAEKAIDIAVTNGVCQGISSTIFSPDTPITREEAAKMVANYLKIADTNIDKLQKFTDNAKVSSWARAEMEGTIEAGYFNGYPDNTLRPQGNITRAETVVVMGRLKH